MNTTTYPFGPSPTYPEIAFLSYEKKGKKCFGWHTIINEHVAGEALALGNRTDKELEEIKQTFREDAEAYADNYGGEFASVTN